MYPFQLYTVFNKCILRPPLYYNTAKYVHLVCWIFMYNFRGRGLNRQIYQAAPILPLQFTILYCIRHHSMLVHKQPAHLLLVHSFVCVCIICLCLFVCIIYFCLFVSFITVYSYLYLYIKLICFPPCRSAAPLFCETNLSVWDCSQQSCSTDKCSYCICSH